MHSMSDAAISGVAAMIFVSVASTLAGAGVSFGIVALALATALLTAGCGAMSRSATIWAETGSAVIAAKSAIREAERRMVKGIYPHSIARPGPTIPK